MSNTILPPAVTKDEGGVRFWDTCDREYPAWSEVRLGGEVLVSFDGGAWKSLDDCTSDERAVVIALRHLHYGYSLAGLPLMIADWSDAEVVDRLGVSLAEVPWLREGNGAWWSLEAAMSLDLYLGVGHTEFFARAEAAPTPGKALADLRKRAGMTRRQLARAAGTSRKFIIMIEKGECAPSQSFMARLSGVVASHLA